MAHTRRSNNDDISSDNNDNDDNDSDVDSDITVLTMMVAPRLVQARAASRAGGKPEHSMMMSNLVTIMMMRVMLIVWVTMMIMRMMIMMMVSYLDNSASTDSISEARLLGSVTVNPVPDEDERLLYLKSSD